MSISESTAGSEARAGDLLLLDGHVHIYECFDVARFLSAAWAHFAAEARRRGQEAFHGVLLLSETARDDAFGRLLGLAREGRALEGPEEKWSFEETDEACSLRARSSSGRALLLVAGRQIVTDEGLEVLALGTEARFQDGGSLEAVVEAVRDADAVPVIPWGVGKWLGERGRVLTDFLARTPTDELLVGDNSGRPVFWREPFHFRVAARRAIRILPGTDPLPFRSEGDRAGRFGAAAHGHLDPDRPAASLKSLLRSEGFLPEPYGALESPLRFLRNQIGMQIVKRRRGS